MRGLLLALFFTAAALPGYCEPFSREKVKVDSQADIILLPVWLFVRVVLELKIKS